MQRVLQVQHLGLHLVILLQLLLPRGPQHNPPAPTDRAPLCQFHRSLRLSLQMPAGELGRGLEAGVQHHHQQPGQHPYPDQEVLVGGALGRSGSAGGHVSPGPGLPFHSAPAPPGQEEGSAEDQRQESEEQRYRNAQPPPINI